MPQPKTCLKSKCEIFWTLPVVPRVPAWGGAVIPSVSRDLGEVPQASGWDTAEMFRLRRKAPALNMTGGGGAEPHFPASGGDVWVALRNMQE